MIDLNTYDFLNDVEFQEFFKEKRKGQFLSKNKYMTLLGWCKREWVRMHNAPYRQRSAK